MRARSPAILLGILNPVSHFRMGKKWGKKSAYRILSFSCQQCVAFYHDAHSLPFTNYGQQGFYQEKNGKKNQVFSFSILYWVRNRSVISKNKGLQLGLRMQPQAQQLQLHWFHKNSVLAVAWKKAQCPYTVSQKSLQSHTSFVKAKIPTIVEEYLYPLHQTKKVILIHNPRSQKSPVPL